MIPERMKYVACSKPGGADVLEIREGPTPRPGPSEVLIRVHAAGINRPDLLQRDGKYAPPPGASPILGLEVAGEVVACAPGSRWKVGDRVAALVPGGGYAEFCVAPDPQCLPWPSRLSANEAAAIPETFFTVWYNVFRIGQLHAGERFLVHGGTSGIGVTAIQLARAFGADVFATAGNPEKCQACRELGARVAIDYHTQDFVAEALRESGDRGLDVILDMVGGPYTPRNLKALAPLGRLVQIAFLQGMEATVNLSLVMQKRLTITGSTMRPRTVAEKGEIAADLEAKVWPMIEDGRVRIVLDQVYPFDQVRAAHRRMESSQHIGKLAINLI